MAIYRLSLCLFPLVCYVSRSILFRSSFSSQLTSYGLQIWKRPSQVPATWEAASDAWSLVSFSDFLCGNVQHPRQKSLFSGERVLSLLEPTGSSSGLWVYSFNPLTEW